MTVDIPGAFDTFFTGTGCYAGQPYTSDPEMERGSRELAAAYRSARHITRGKGYTLRAELPSIEAAVVLAEHAVWCIGRNADEPEYSEMSAARKVAERVEQATEGRVVFNGWYITLDGVKT